MNFRCQHPQGNLWLNYNVTPASRLIRHLLINSVEYVGDTYFNFYACRWRIAIDL